MNGDAEAQALPAGISSLLDTDLYKLTMQCAVLKYFPDVLTNQSSELWNLSLSPEEIQYLETRCTYLNRPYLRFLENFRLQPDEQIVASFQVLEDTGSDDDIGDIHLDIKGSWVDTILYEIPLLALTSEAYFRFCDTDWSYKRQEEKAYQKGATLLQHGCLFSEFGTRRRRDYHTQDLVLQGLTRAAEEGEDKGWKGKLSGTSNVHFAMKHGITPVGTVAHEWFMGIAAITNDYESVSETALRYWIGCFGEGVLGIALTDTFGTLSFLEAFRRPIPSFTIAAEGKAATLPSVAAASTTPSMTSLSNTRPPLHAPVENGATREPPKSYAQTFVGVRQDSGDPVGFVKMMRDFYDNLGIKEKKTIVFSDSLNIELCLEYMQAAEEAGFQPTFGVGTFLTNDFVHESNGKKSVPLNIVIKLSSAGGRPAVKISDNIGKNTGDTKTVEEVKQRLGYVEKNWEGGDEKSRWGTENDERRTTSVATWIGRKG
ncbi:MAG: nicotinate phosphoribosyltransferase [Pleopsidium flavum]|nr:MAG: nicotinate phosphoribosyltransferase [Pleopsidium flavum]